MASKNPRTQRGKWRADRGTRALKQLAEIEDLIVDLSDDDLLDLADIFVSKPHSALGMLSAAEMARRNITLETP